MPAAKYDITIDQGSDFEISVQVFEDDAPKNLDGFGARAQLRQKLDASGATSFDTSGSQLDSNGTVKIALSNQTTKNITPGAYVYDIEIFEGTAPNETSVVRILQGKATVTGEVTR